MRYLNFIVKFGELGGFLLLVLGFFLMPLGIGIPIFICGIVIMIIGFYKKWINLFIPKNFREKIGRAIVQSYKPHRPAIRSMRTVGRETLKNALKVLIVLALVVAIVLVGYMHSKR